MRCSRRGWRQENTQHQAEQSHRGSEDMNRHSFQNDQYLSSLDLSAVKLVSLDIFDTLLLRTCSKPVEVFAEIGTRATRAGWIPKHIGPQEFQQIRESAESRARQRRWQMCQKGEVTIRQIYDEMPDWCTPRSRFIHLELRVEQDVCYPNPYVLDLIDHCRKRSVPIALCSDMYLGNRHIRKLLERLGIPPKLFAEIMVSCDMDATKWAGNLFPILLRRFPGIKPGEILHIGDNPHSDCIMPKRHGLKAHHYGVVPNSTQVSVHEDLYGIHLPELFHLRRLAVSQNYANRANGRFWFHLGASVLGPLLSAFCEWILDQCLDAGIRTVCPIMREANTLVPLLQRAAEARGIKMRILPAYMSRQAVFLAGQTVVDVHQVAKWLPMGALSLAELFRLLHLPLPKWLNPHRNLRLGQYDSFRNGSDQSIRIQVLEYLTSREIKCQLESLIAKNRRLLVDYAAQLSPGGEPFALADMGSGATVSRHVHTALRSQGDTRQLLHLLAYGTPYTDQHILDGLDLRGYIGIAGKNYDWITRLMRAPEPLEELQFGDEGTTIGYTRANSHIRPQLAPCTINEKELGWKRSCQEGIFAYQALWFNLLESKPQLRQRLVHELALEYCRLYARLIEFPTAEEAARIGELYHDFGLGGALGGKLCSKKADQRLQLLGPEKFLEDTRTPFPSCGVFWPQGVVTRRFPAYFAGHFMNSSNGKGAYLYVMSKVAGRVRDDSHKKVVVYGAAEIGRAARLALMVHDVSTSCFVDSNRELWGTSVEGVPVHSLDSAWTKGHRVFVVGSLAHAREIRDTICSRGINGDKPIVYTV
jgi:FMN phosphatase YigB (HAD superfamily)